MQKITLFGGGSRGRSSGGGWLGAGFRALYPVFGTADPPFFNPGCIKGSSNDMVADSR